MTLKEASLMHQQMQSIKSATDSMYHVFQPLNYQMQSISEAVKLMSQSLQPIYQNLEFFKKTILTAHSVSSFDSKSALYEAGKSISNIVENLYSAKELHSIIRSFNFPTENWTEIIGIESYNVLKNIQSKNLFNSINTAIDSLTHEDIKENMELEINNETIIINSSTINIFRKKLKDLEYSDNESIKLAILFSILLILYQTWQFVPNVQLIFAINQLSEYIATLVSFIPDKINNLSNPDDVSGLLVGTAAMSLISYIIQHFILS